MFYYDQISFCIAISILLTMFFQSGYRNFKKIVSTKPHVSIKELMSGVNNLTPEEIKKQQKRNELLDSIKFCIGVYANFHSIFIFVGLTVETYLYGAKMYTNIFAVMIAYIFVGIIIQPFLYDLDKSIKTPYEYFQRRYNCKFVRMLVASVGCLFSISFYSLFLASVGLNLSTVFPNMIGLWASMILFGVLSIIGSCLGGLIQTTRLMVVQFFLCFFGISVALAITFYGSKRFTNEQLWDIADKYSRKNAFDTNLDLITRYTILSQCISLPIPWCTMHSLLPNMFQKYRAIGTKLKSRLFLLSNMPIHAVIYTVVFMCGYASFVYFYDCDPRYINEVENKNQIAALWFMKSLAEYLPTFSGICMAAIISWGLYSHSNGLLLTADIIINDILKQIGPTDRFLEKYFEKSPLMKIAFKNVLIVIIGLISIVYSISFLYTERSILALFFLFNNSLNSNILGIFLLSIFNPFANFVGASIGFICGVSLNIWIGLSSVVSAKLISQEIKPFSFGCNANISQAFVDKLESKNYYPTNPTLFFIYSINPIWLCSLGLYTTLIVGTLSSFIYSFIKTRSLDCDSKNALERKQYTFGLRVFKN